MRGNHGATGLPGLRRHLCKNVVASAQVVLLAYRDLTSSIPANILVLFSGGLRASLDRREADWSTAPILHLVTSKAPFNTSESLHYPIVEHWAPCQAILVMMRLAMLSHPCQDATSNGHALLRPGISECGAMSIALNTEHNVCQLGHA